RDQKLANGLPANQMLLDDALQHWRVAPRVPRAFRIDDGDRSAFADAQAVRLCPQGAALLRQTELLQAALEEVPRCEAAILLAALRVGLIAAEKNVTPRDRNADALRDLALGFRCRTHSDPTRCRARSAEPCSRRAPTRRRRRDWRDSPRHRAPCDSA